MFHFKNKQFEISTAVPLIVLASGITKEHILRGSFWSQSSRLAVQCRLWKHGLKLSCWFWQKREWAEKWQQQRVNTLATATWELLCFDSWKELNLIAPAFRNFRTGVFWSLVHAIAEVGETYSSVTVSGMFWGMSVSPALRQSTMPSAHRQPVGQALGTLHSCGCELSSAPATQNICVSESVKQEWLFERSWRNLMSSRRCHSCDWNRCPANTRQLRNLVPMPALCQIYPLRNS